MVNKDQSIIGKSRIVGISGYARSGKDTAFLAIKDILEEKNIERIAFADALKLECLDFLRKNTGISTFTSVDSEKEIIRPFLVAYGTNVRRKLDPRCWIKVIDEKIKSKQKTDLFVITDTRYQNEAEWIKENGGILINIEREGIDAANQEEREQGPILKSMSDVSIKMPTFRENYKEKCKSIIKETIKLC
jgi:hypothetical protein